MLKHGSQLYVDAYQRAHLTTNILRLTDSFYFCLTPSRLTIKIYHCLWLSNSKYNFKLLCVKSCNLRMIIDKYLVEMEKKETFCVSAILYLRGKKCQFNMKQWVLVLHFQINELCLDKFTKIIPNYCARI